MEKYNIETEIWKDIKGYEGYYQVSNLGRVQSLNRTVKVKTKAGEFERFFTGKVLISSLRKGYPRIILSKNSIHKHKSIHRLVAEHFIENPNNLEQVNHIDCNKENNNVNNLEWVTHVGNARHAVENGMYKRGSKHIQSKVKIKHVPQILKLYFEDGLLQNEISDKYNVAQTMISTIISGKSWHFQENRKLIILLKKYIKDKPYNNTFLNKKMVEDILIEHFVNDKSQSSISEIYGISVSTVNRVVHGKSQIFKDDKYLANKQKKLKNDCSKYN